MAQSHCLASGLYYSMMSTAVIIRTIILPRPHSEP